MKGKMEQWDVRAELDGNPSMGAGIIKLKLFKRMSGSMKMYELHKSLQFFR